MRQVTVTLRAAALDTNRQTVATPSLSIHPARGRAMLTGTLLNANESLVRTGGASLTLTLQGE